jgi:hypothetical protein
MEDTSRIRMRPVVNRIARSDASKLNLANSKSTCYIHYVTRSTHDVDDGEDLELYSDPLLLVLVSLGDGPKHGQAMLEDLFEMRGTRLGPGTLFGAIARLERVKLFEPLAADERRQPYRLTTCGARVLRAKLKTRYELARVGLKKLEAR